MLGRKCLKLTVIAGAVGLVTPAGAQQAAQPANSSELPQVEVIQKKKSGPASAKKKAAPSQASSPVPQPPSAAPVVADETPALENSPYGAAASGAAALRAARGAQSPINAKALLPEDLQDFAGAGSRVSTEQIDSQRPKDNHELLARVPGVMVVDDDGSARHSNIGMRGSPVRRSRKVLVMEDGVPINFSTYLDPSTHYTPPTHRLESVEVLRGTVVVHGPLNNHGVVNFRNLSPFGANETVVTAAIGNTEGANRDVNNYRHVHTRQNLGNAGVVASYSGGDSGGAWDNEEQRYNDFYGALGLRGTQQDLTISGGYFRQRDTYDETNFIGFKPDFFANGHRKSNSPAFQGRDQANGQLDLNSYNADLYRIQAAHNLYLNDDTTLSTRVYYSHNERNRFESRRGGPFAAAGTGGMRGRERTYEVYGADSRLEIADLPLFAGVTYDLQAGLRIERHDFRNCNSSSVRREKLDADNGGECIALRNITTNNGILHVEDGRLVTFESDSVAAFIQTAIHVTRNLTVTPGVRFENYDITRNAIHNPEAPTTAGIATSDHDHVLPGIAIAWEALPRSTLYGGFHQGITPQVARGPAFPLPDEEGDNYQIGFRSTAVRGLTLDLAYFRSNIENYQVKEAADDAFGNAVYGTVDEVEINGFELYSRLDSRPFTNSAWNFFAEAVYTYADSEITASPDVAEIGNLVPEVPRHFANLTLGFEHRSGFDASVTATYRGEFFTDTLNSVGFRCVDEDGGPIGCDDGDADAIFGKVDGQWLLSARANYAIPNTNVTLFVSGQNLTDELYLSDMSNGAKPGVGRTVWAGFTYKFD